MPLLQRVSPRRQPAIASIAPESDLNDRALVAAARRHPGDFAPLFLRYWDPVLRYCTVRLSHPDEAEDAASQIFVDAYAGLYRFQVRGESGSFRSWLFTIAHHEIVDRYRYRARHPACPLEAIEELELAGSDAPSDYDTSAVDLSDVVAQIQELPDRPREVVGLRLAGLNDREIAAVLGISGPAVRQAQSRAVAQLRMRMGHPR